MANALYDKGREHFLDGSLDWDTQDIRFVFTDHGEDTPVVATDEDLDDIDDGSATIATSDTLASKTIAAGVADAADSTVSTVSGAEFESINIYYHTGTASTSLLIAYIDTATGLPCTPNGGDITVQWDSSANKKIFKL